ncbi:uncharacterized protein GGS22DRAFT_165887 [Annulohypoxylon maeteangense]|uniref:uncharacterized protein n=1 Tax=Annulohypoxylon maeteangense TaxID=1927788 RepID=UPI002007B3DA|nr:uncharacterized protein GGS22DRAFT_165887 [Annulohypoxylon maeteangense]KAI0883713.1 hypothetical protein GGS22DRAFT_165887 [Annulohypoxylon maeteangense]
MEDAPSDSRTPSPLPYNFVHVPIRAIHDAFLQHFVPYDNPAVFEVRPIHWHRKHEGIFLFRYTDFRGWPAVQPAATERRIRNYFRPLVYEEQRCGAVDTLLLDARAWSCWAQGFTHLEPELRWVLTLIFDLIGIIIAKQMATGTRIPVTPGGNVDMEADDQSGKLFWEGRYYLHNLMAVVKEMKTTFGVPNLTIPRLPWLDGN